MHRRVPLLLVLIFLLPHAAAFGAEDKTDKAIRSSVLKVLATQRGPHYLRPWTRANPRSVTGSAVVIEGGKILTNAHLVVFASQIYVQPYQSSEKIPAKVEALATGIDLALLSVEEKDFFKTRPGLAMSPDLPKVRDVVNVYGYPVGGVDMSITKGAVARIEYLAYGMINGLRVEVDAAIGPGSSGGPAIVNGRMIGVVYGMSNLGQKMGFVIPTEEITAFLSDVADGTYHGKLHIWEYVQTLENDALRAKLELKKETTGVLVRRIRRNAADLPLKKGDVVTKIHDHAIDNDGRVQIKEHLRLPFTYLVPKLARDGKVRLTVLRDGKTSAIDVPVSYTHGDPLLKPLFDKYPSYFVWGPLAFSPAGAEAVNALGRYLAPQWTVQESPLIRRRHDFTAFDGEELVMVTTMFPHKTSKGYGSPLGRIVREVDGVAIRNLKHLVETLRDAKGKFVQFEFQGKYAETLVFDRQEVLDSMEDILTDNAIRRQCSPDLTDTWENGGKK